MEVCEDIYHVTASFPKQEQYGLVTQMRRAAVSLPSNIAEGFVRRHAKEFKQFLSVSLASLAELETQVMLSVRLGYFSENNSVNVLEKMDHLGRMTTRFYQYLST